MKKDKIKRLPKRILEKILRRKKVKNNFIALVIIKDYKYF